MGADKADDGAGERSPVLQQPVPTPRVQKLAANGCIAQGEEQSAEYVKGELRPAEDEEGQDLVEGEGARQGSAAEIGGVGVKREIRWWWWRRRVR